MNTRDRILAICHEHNLIPEATVGLAEEIIAIIKEDGGGSKLRPYQQKAIDDLRESFKKPELIQGYTAEQWQEIIAGGYLCEFSDQQGVKYTKRFLKEIIDQKNFIFKDDVGAVWKYCRPAQIKGVMRPIFVEPVGDPYCVFFDIDGKALHTGMMRFNFRKENPGYAGDTARATKYIEL